MKTDRRLALRRERLAELSAEDLTGLAGAAPQNTVVECPTDWGNSCTTCWSIGVLTICFDDGR